MALLTASSLCVSVCMCEIVNYRDRLEVRTLHCGRNNPGSNPGHGILLV